MAKSRSVLTVGIAALVLLAASAGLGAARSASAAICGDTELERGGSGPVSGCGGSILQIPATLPTAPAVTPPAAPAVTLAAINEIHFASGTSSANGVTEAQQPRSTANLGRSGRSPAPASSASAAAVTELPARKTIDLRQLPASLVAPSR